MAIERINIISDDPIDVSYDAPQSIRVIDDSEVRVVRIVENVESVDHIGVFSDNLSIISDNVPSTVRIVNDSEIRVVKIVESGPQGRPGTSGTILNGSFTGSFSGSFYGNGSELTNIVSSSYALSASYAPGALTDGATYNITSSWAISASYVSSQYYATFSQPALATTWSFNHNLNYKYPIITVWNTEDEVIIPEKIFAASTSQSIVYFPVPVSGYASATVGSILPTSTGSSGGGSATLPPNVVSSSLQFFTITAPFTGSFTGSFVGDGSGITGVTATLPANIVSSSAQIIFSGISSIPSGIISSSFQIASDVSGAFNAASSSFSTRVTNVENKTTYSGSFSGSFQGNGSGLTNLTLPVNLISSSAQISYSGISNVPSNIVSSSLQFTNITSPFTGSFTGSFRGDGSGLTGISATLPSNVVSSSAQIIYSGISGIPSNLISSSFQIASDISGSFNGASSSFSTRVTNIEAKVIYSGSFSGSFVGDGSGLTGITAIFPANVVSSSLQFITITSPFTGSFTGSFKGDGSGLTGVSVVLPSNIISSSFQIAPDISGSFNSASSSFSNRVTTLETKTTYTGSFTGSFIGDGSGLTNLNLPSNLVSSSTQISYAGIINVPLNIVSSSAQITYSGISSIPSNIVSSSLQFFTITSPFTGSFTGSFKGDGSGLTSIASSSYALSASYAPGGSTVQTIGARIQTEDAYITAGSKGYRHINSNSTIIKTRTISTITGSINVNIRRNGTTLGNISLVSQTGSIDTVLAGWTTSLLRDDLLEFYVSGSSTYITDIILFIDIQT